MPLAFPIETLIEVSCGEGGVVLGKLLRKHAQDRRDIGRDD
jgi:hypothetical protein